MASKETLPVYLPITRLDQVIELISKRSLTDVSSGFFVAHKFNQSDASLAVNMLKFLGVADENGKVIQETFRKFQVLGESRKKGIEEIIRPAYAKLFGTVEAPQDLPINELTNDLARIYGLSARVSKPATLAFLKLCEYAGLKEEGSIVGRKRTEGSNKSGQTTNTKSGSESQSSRGRSSERDDLIHIDTGTSEVVFRISKDIQDRAWNNDDLNADMRILVRSVKAFAEKYGIPKENDSLTEGKA